MIVNPASRLGRWLHGLFEASLVIKGIFAGGESLGGVGLLLTPNLRVLGFVGWLMQDHLAQGARAAPGLVAQGLAESFTVTDQHVYAMYLLAHGALKLGMVVLLARRRIRAYPWVMALLAGFVAYEVHEFRDAGHLGFLVLAVLDGVMIGLVWREWNLLKLGPAT